MVQLFEHMRKKAGFALLCVVVLMSLCATLLVGCGSDASIKDRYTSADTNEKAETSNLVNPNQLPDSSFLYDADITDLANADSFYNGQTVQTTGEVVGDHIASEDEYDNFWITLQKQGVANPDCVLVLMNKAQADLIDTYGDYRHNGSTVQVRGTFNLVCKYHQGQSDIHASEVAVIKAGSEKKNEVNSVILTAGILSVIIGVLLLIFYNYRKELEL